jgi:predicted transcriptional regulator
MPSARKGREAPPPLSRRERQIMDVIYQVEMATAADVHAAMQDPPTYTTVRGLLRILVEKGHVLQKQEGRRYVYLPATPRPAAGASHLKHVVRTFFAGSPADAMAALLGSDRDQVTDIELARLEDLVARARRTRRGKDG